MNIFDNIEQCISNLPYNISSIKAWYDGTITFRMSEFLCDVSLDVIQSEIRLTLSIDEDSFTNREITVSDSGLIYLANVLNSNIDAVSFFALIEDGAQSLCLKKTYNYATSDEAMRFLYQSITSLKRVAEATLSVAEFFFTEEDSTDFYDRIIREMNKSTFASIAQTLPPLNILIINDLFTKEHTLLKSRLCMWLPKCKIFEATRKLNPKDMMYAIENEVRKHNIDIVIAYGSGCFFAHQLNGVQKLLLNPKFYISKELQNHVDEINTDSTDMPYDNDTYRHTAIKLCKNMEERQFMNLSSDMIESAVGYFETGKCYDKNARIFNSVYGPIYALPDDWFSGDAFIRFGLIPAIEHLYFKSRSYPFTINTTRAMFAEHLRAVINDHIAYARPALYNENTYIKVSPFTHDITVDSGYRATLLERMNKDGDIIPDEDMIKYLTLKRFPDKSVTDFIDRILMVTDPYCLNQSHKLTDILLAIDKTDLSMTVRFKDKSGPVNKSKSEDVYPLSRFLKRTTRHKITTISMVKLTAIALKYIPVKGLGNP